MGWVGGGVGWLGGVGVSAHGFSKVDASAPVGASRGWLFLFMIWAPVGVSCLLLLVCAHGRRAAPCPLRQLGCSGALLLTHRHGRSLGCNYRLVAN